MQDLKARAETDPVAAAELAQQRAQQSEAVKKSRQKMYADAAAGDPEAQARYERMLAARRENYHRRNRQKPKLLKSANVDTENARDNDSPWRFCHYCRSSKSIYF